MAKSRKADKNLGRNPMPTWLWVVAVFVVAAIAFYFILYNLSAASEATSLPL